MVALLFEKISLKPYEYIRYACFFQYYSQRYRSMNFKKPLTSVFYTEHLRAKTTFITRISQT